MFKRFSSSSTLDKKVDVVIYKKVELHAYLHHVEIHVEKNLQTYVTSYQTLYISFCALGLVSPFIGINNLFCMYAMQITNSRLLKAGISCMYVQ